MPGFSLNRAIAMVAAFLAIGIISVIFLNLTAAPDNVPTVESSGPLRRVIGLSAEERSIEAFTYGNGNTHLFFVGGIHGGYEWNSILLAYNFIDYLKDNPEEIPENLKISVVPSANPDGQFAVLGKSGKFALADAPQAEDPAGKGRFNANDVDLNRNFDCKWKPKSQWRGTEVSAGTGPFSEPEARALRDFVLEHRPAAVIFWHSKAGAVYASECHEGILSQTLDIMNAYADAAEYVAVEKFDAYEITGDAEGWLASVGIPAITVELTTHTSVEWEKNLAGVKAIIEYFVTK